MSDTRLVCVDCGEAFIWSHGEQRYYRERGLSQPKRCKNCRSQRRREQDSGNMGFSGPPARSTAPRPRTRPARRPSRSWWGKPSLRYGLITFGITIILTLIMLAFDSPLDLLMAWLIAITIVTFWTFGYDKAIAGGTTVRVPENILFALVFCGGTLGALLARPFFHHKTSKVSFRLKFWLVVIVQILLIAGYYLWVKPRLGF